MTVPVLLLALAACRPPSQPAPDPGVDSGVDTAAPDPGVDSGVDTAAPESWAMPVLDFGRGLTYIADDSERATAYDAFVPLVDVAEAAVGSDQLAELTARDPSLTTFSYQLDLTGCQHVDCGGSMPVDTRWDALSESHFLHFSEATRLHFYALDDSDLGAIDVPGCGSEVESTAACRAQTYVWGDRRFLLAVGDPALRDTMASWLLAATDPTVRGVFLDEHSHQLTEAMKFGVQAVIESGGAIREYDGLRPGDPALDTAWSADVAGALAAYREALAAQQRFLLVNVATYYTAADAQAQAQAAGGVTVEGLWRPDAFDGTSRFFGVVTALRTLVQAGGRADLYGVLGYTGPSGYTAGAYADPVSRYRMWRLGASLLVRASSADTGVAYFNPTLDIDFLGDALAWRDEWLPAYTVDLGAPLDEPALHEGASYTASDGTTCSVAWVERHFARGQVLVRAKDAWNCGDWDAVVDVPLDAPMVPLRPDGSYGEAVTVVPLHNGEAWVLAAP
ncbi:MAG: hypothetical protein FJ090_20895 [Deltaproteobacteria bacterium]|nr:hypothetical protein [Deltaproteobacteria bacterium]